MSKRAEVKVWIAKENARLKEKNGGNEYYRYFIEGNHVRYMDYDRAPWSWTICGFWNEFVRPRTEEELLAMEWEREEHRRRMEEIEKEQLEEERKKQLEEDLEFYRLTGSIAKAAVFHEELPEDGKIYYRTDKGYTEIK